MFKIKKRISILKKISIINNKIIQIVCIIIIVMNKINKLNKQSKDNKKLYDNDNDNDLFIIHIMR